MLIVDLLATKLEKYQPHKLLNINFPNVSITVAFVNTIRRAEYGPPQYSSPPLFVYGMTIFMVIAPRMSRTTSCSFDLQEAVGHLITSGDRLRNCTVSGLQKSNEYRTYNAFFLINHLSTALQEEVRDIGIRKFIHIVTRTQRTKRRLPHF